MRPAASNRSTSFLRTANRSKPCNASVTSSSGDGGTSLRKAALSFRSRCASASNTLISGSSCRRPTSKSLKSCAGVIVTDYRNAPADQRQDGRLADQMLEPLIFRMHRDRDVAEHGFGPCRCHDDEFVTAVDRIFDEPEAALGLDLLHFEIGDRGFQFRVPIDQPLVLVDEALAVKRDEHLHHRARQALVHGEAFARPVAGGAEPLELRNDGAARLRLPFPDALDEFLTA